MMRAKRKATECFPEIISLQSAEIVAEGKPRQPHLPRRRVSGITPWRDSQTPCFLNLQLSWLVKYTG
jgi:hypothetical protein